MVSRTFWAGHYSGVIHIFYVFLTNNVVVDDVQVLGAKVQTYGFKTGFLPNSMLLMLLSYFALIVSGIFCCYINRDSLVHLVIFKEDDYHLLVTVKVCIKLGLSGAGA